VIENIRAAVARAAARKAFGANLITPFIATLPEREGSFPLAEQVRVVVGSTPPYARFGPIDLESPQQDLKATVRNRAEEVPLPDLMAQRATA
jgi:hypothetical protein